MKRLRRGFPVYLLFLLAGLVVTLTGCEMIGGALYIIKGRDQEPNCKTLLKGEHKVVVVTRAPAYVSQFGCETVHSDISQEVSYLIAANANNKKLKMISQNKVEDWFDRNDYTFERFTDIGKDLKADYVVGIEIDSFTLQEPQSRNLYRGRASVHVKLYNCKTGNVEHSESFSNIVYPANSHLDLDSVNKTPSDFRREFVKVVAIQVAAQFHPYDPLKVKPFDGDLIK